MSVLITGATIIDGVAPAPIEGCDIWIEAGRIAAIGRREELAIPATAKVIDARGRFVIPGLMNANVHFLADLRLENLARYMDQFEGLIAESAQMALKNGLTTVFETYGPRRYLMAVRDRINAGEISGSRFFCAGNILGFDGPFSDDFFPLASQVASASLVKRINAIWVENVGRHLMWLSPAQVAREVRTYIGRGIDFVKYGANDHFPGSFLAFSPRVQAAIVAEAHHAGVIAQAHTLSVEGLHGAIEAGCDLVQHANITGPNPIPEETLELLAERKIGAVVFPFTARRFETIMKGASDKRRTVFALTDLNARNLISCGASILLGNDGSMWAPEVAGDPVLKGGWSAPGEDNLGDLATGHFAWFKAMEEKDCPPMEMLRAATRNIAVAYGKDKDLGTLERGKIADMLILDKNPLQAAENYRRIHMVLKDGKVVDRDALPTNPVLTKPMQGAVEEESSYVPFFVSGTPQC